MLSRILLQVASTRFIYLLLLWLSAAVLAVGIGTAALAAAYRIDRDTSSTLPNLVMQSAAATFGLASLDLGRPPDLTAWVTVCQALLGVLLNGVFVALIAFRAIRVNHSALVFASHVLLSPREDGSWRLEFRIANDSNYEIANVGVRVQLAEYLDSFPRSTEHQTSKVPLNWDEYLVLTPHGYLLVSTAPNPKPLTTGGERIARVDESLLHRRFFLRVLIHGQYVRSGLSFLETHIYDGASVHKGQWRYYLREDLERRGRIRLEEFNAFDPA